MRYEINVEYFLSDMAKSVMKENKKIESDWKQLGQIKDEIRPRDSNMSEFISNCKNEVSLQLQKKIKVYYDLIYHRDFLEDTILPIVNRRDIMILNKINYDKKLIKVYEEKYFDKINFGFKPTEIESILEKWDAKLDNIEENIISDIIDEVWDEISLKYVYSQI